MGTITILSFLVVQMISSALGEPSYYRQYRILSGGYPNTYYQPQPYYYQSSQPVRFTETPYRYSYYTNPYTENPYRYKYTTTPAPSYSNRYYNDDKVYVTDKYGRTTVQSASSLRQYYSRDYSRAMAPYVRSETCTASTCGQNAQCTVIGSRPVCSCMRGHSGDPISLCRRAECLDNSECRGHQTCRNGNCINPCDGVCGPNANCEVRQHVPVCSCPPGYTGDPFTSCRRFDPSELCHPSPCGANTNCEVINGTPTCKCIPGYHGSPLAGCRHECENDAECGPSLACIKFKCQNPCSLCGENAECDGVRSHVASCKCPKGYYGDPFTSCRPECVSDSECPRSKPACYYNSCKNPCDGACGVGANCELRGLTPVCSCPRDMTGDPFVSCRPFDKRDLCEPNPCGANARCEPGYDRTNKERPVCLCHTGYTGDPLTGCVRGECTADEHCPDSQACINYRCENPCRGQCGVNANCNPRRHLAVCTCPPGYNGDALSQCYQVQGTSVGSRYG